MIYKKELKKPNEKKFRVEKVIKRKGNKLYVKLKKYNHFFNSQNNKKDIVQISKSFPKPKRFGRNVKVE